MHNLSDLANRFKSVEIDSEELEKIVKAFIKETHPSKKVVEIKRVDFGVIVVLDNNDEVEIDIDWGELILKPTKDLS